jgi:alkanesulfonate monooxygenase SsuD/methylene tetrahydromethanopterin reductase-like flavin-dependent oxidoreductase (luciferase family)
MRFGAHLPLIDFDGAPFAVSALTTYVDAAADGGFFAISANDHLVFQRPWLDGIVALSSVLERARGLTLATTVALPVIRGPVPLAKAAAALQTLSDGRLVLGVGAGSSAADYAAVGVPFEERWPRFEVAVRTLRSELAEVPGPIPIWIGSWGSPAGLRRVARLGDGWIASAYNTTPERLATDRGVLQAALRTHGREESAFPIALATMWTHLTDSKAEAQEKLQALATMLGRDPAQLAGQVLIGDPDRCAELLGKFADAGVDSIFIWPLGDPVAQLQRFGADVLPRLSSRSSS